MNQNLPPGCLPRDIEGSQPESDTPRDWDDDGFRSGAQLADEKAERDAFVKSGTELEAPEVLGCPLPLCFGEADMTELRYANTGNIYGYLIKCAGCGLELRRQPAGWPCGHKKETMETAKAEILTLWNTRPMPNIKPLTPVITADELKEKLK